MVASLRNLSARGVRIGPVPIPAVTLVTRFLDTFVGSAGTLIGHVPDQGGTAWIPTGINLNAALTGAGKIVNGTAGFGADGYSTNAGGVTTALSKLGIFLEATVPVISPIPTGGISNSGSTQAMVVIQDLGLGGEDTVAYVGFDSYGTTTGVGPPNTQAIVFILPGIGYNQFVISSGINLSGPQKVRLEGYFDGAWSVYLNDVLATSGTGYTSALAGAVNSNLTMSFYLTPPGAPLEFLELEEIRYGTIE